MNRFFNKLLILFFLFFNLVYVFAEALSSNQLNNMESYNFDVTKNKISKHKRKKISSKYSNKSEKASIYDLTFDFNYIGDLAQLPLTLHQYVPSLKMLPNLGTYKYYSINLDVQHVNLGYIIDYIVAQTEGRAKLVYDPIADTIRIVYDTKISVANDAIKESLKWQQGIVPKPILSKDGLVLFPFGQYEPKITCRPLQICDIQFEPGENITGTKIGDPLYWKGGDILYSGSGKDVTPHIIIKPDEPGRETTLLVTTNRRTYYIKLLSMDNVSVSRAGFYYPENEIKLLDQKKQAQIEDDNKVLSPNNVNIKDMYFNYSISGDTSATFKPTQIFDDGKQTYIQLSPQVAASDLPAFYILATDGVTLQLVNYRWKKPYFIVDKIFEQGVMVLGTDDNEQKIKIKRNKEKSFWSSLFGAN